MTTNLKVALAVLVGVSIGIAGARAMRAAASQHSSGLRHCGSRSD